MPELPEVETVRRRLQTCLPGLLLREVVVNDWTVSAQTEEELNGHLAGRRVTGASPARQVSPGGRGTV